MHQKLTLIPQCHYIYISIMVKYIFLIQGYEDEQTDGKISDVVTVELIDKTPENAIERAKKMIHKKNYRITSIIEKDK